MSKMSDIDILTSEIAEEIISAARNSGDEPVVFVTGNSYMPPARSFSAMEEIWQEDYERDEPVFDWVWELVEEKVEEANVYLGCSDYDNALYAVDMNRFQFNESDTEATDLQDEWEMYDSE